MLQANESPAAFRLGELLGEDDLAELRQAVSSGPRSAYARHYFVSSWSPEREERFRATAEACMRLAHPTIAPILAYGVSAGRPFVIYERRPSLSLRAFLRHTHELPAQSATWLLTRVAIALELAPPRARLGICPDSILLTGEGEVEVRDLGILALGRREDMAGAKHGGIAAYCAPEVIDGGEPTAGAGVFALGVCVYEALMGEPPFQGRTMLANLVHAKMGKFRRIDEDRAPTELRDLVHRMLAADPAARPTIAELTREGARLAWRDSRPANLGAMVREWIAPAEHAPDAPPPDSTRSPGVGDGDTSPSVSLPLDDAAPPVAARRPSAALDAAPPAGTPSVALDAAQPAAARRPSAALDDPAPPAAAPAPSASFPLDVAAPPPASRPPSASFPLDAPAPPAASRPPSVSPDPFGAPALAEVAYAGLAGFDATTLSPAPREGGAGAFVPTLVLELPRHEGERPTPAPPPRRRVARAARGPLSARAVAIAVVAALAMLNVLLLIVLLHVSMS